MACAIYVGQMVMKTQLPNAHPWKMYIAPRSYPKMPTTRVPPALPLVKQTMK